MDDQDTVQPAGLEPLEAIFSRDTPSERPSAPAGQQEQVQLTEAASSEQGEQAQPAKDGQPRDPSGKFAPKQDAPAGPPPEKDPANVPVAALKDERAKRQQLERQLADMRRQLETFQRQPPAQPQQTQPGSQQPQQQAPKTFWDDPEGAFARAEANLERKFAMELARRDEAFARAQYPDFEEANQAVVEVLNNTPPHMLRHVAELMRADMAQFPSQGEAIYRIGKNILEQRRWADPAAREALLQSEIAKRSASAAPAARPSSPEPLPPSLATARATGSGRSGASTFTEQSIKDILGR